MKIGHPPCDNVPLSSLQLQKWSECEIWALDIHLSRNIFLSVLDEDTLGCMVHSLAVQVIDGLAIHRHRFIHRLLDAAQVIFCQGDDFHETVPRSGAHVVVDGTGRNVKRGSSDR